MPDTYINLLTNEIAKLNILKGELNEDLDEITRHFTNAIQRAYEAGYAEANRAHAQAREAAEWQAVEWAKAQKA